MNKKLKRKKKLAGRREHELSLQRRDIKTPEQRRISTEHNKLKRQNEKKEKGV